MPLCASSHATSAKCPEQVRDRVELVEGSHGDPSVIDNALVGADAVFWLAPPPWQQTLAQAYLDLTRPAAEAIRRHAVPRVVSITSVGQEQRDRFCHDR